MKKKILIRLKEMKLRKNLLKIQLKIIFYRKFLNPVYFIRQWLQSFLTLVRLIFQATKFFTQGEIVIIA